MMTCAVIISIAGYLVILILCSEAFYDLQGGVKSKKQALILMAKLLVWPVTLVWYIISAIAKWWNDLPDE